MDKDQLLYFDIVNVPWNFWVNSFNIICDTYGFVLAEEFGVLF